MRKTVLHMGLAIVASAVGFSSAAMAQSSEEQAACRSDAIQYCRAHVGKPDDMKKCLAANKDKLSASCKKLVESRGG